MTNPYVPTVGSETTPVGERFRWRRILVAMSWSLAIVTGLYAIGAVSFTIAQLSSSASSPSIQKWWLPRLSIVLLLTTVSSFINSLAAFRWNHGHWFRGLLYNVVAIAVIAGPMCLIPWKLLTFSRS